MKAKPQPLVRVYPGIRPDQKESLKKEAVKLGLGDGETLRHIIDVYFKNNK